VFIVVYFIIDSVQKLLDTPLYIQSYTCFRHTFLPGLYTKSLFPNL